jgi:hypothetical protein
MSDDEDSVNNQGINLNDLKEDVDSEPTNDFNQKIIEIFSWTQNDLVDILAQIYNEEPTLFTKKEFAIRANYFHNLEKKTSGNGILEQYNMVGLL